MYTYQYTFNDFTNATDIIVSDLQDAIIQLNLTSGTIAYINSSGTGVSKTVDIYFSNELDVMDKATLDSLIATYTDLPTGVICSIKDIKSSGTNGGTFISNTWNTRDLNVIEGDVAFVTLSNNIVTIKMGSYIIDVKAPSCDVKNNQMRLRNITDSTYTLGTSSYSSKGHMSTSDLREYFTFDVTTQFDIQHICSDTILNIGYGRASGNNTNEVYTTIFIQKID